MRTWCRMVLPCFLLFASAAPPCASEEAEDQEAVREEAEDPAQAEVRKLEETNKRLQAAVGEAGSAELRDGELVVDIPKEEWDKLSPKERNELGEMLRRIWGKEGDGKLRFRLPRHMRSAPSRRGEDGGLPDDVSCDEVGKDVLEDIPTDGLRDSPAAVLPKFFDGAVRDRALDAVAPAAFEGAAGAGLPARPAIPPPSPRRQLPTGFRSFSGEPPEPGKEEDPGEGAKAPAGRYDGMIRKAVADEELGLEHVDGRVIRALLAAKNPSPQGSGGIQQEARDKAESRRVGGTYGLMLVTPEAARWAGVEGDLRDPETNIRAGAKVLDKLTGILGGDVRRGLAAYQAGLGAVRRSGGIPQRRDVQDLMAAYELAYRSGSSAGSAPAETSERGPEPPVEPVEPPSSEPLKQAAGALREGVEAALEGTPPIGEDRPKYSIPSKVNKYLDRVAEIAEEAGVDPHLAQGIMYAEMGHMGKPGYCNAWGACGLMQIKPGTMREMVNRGYLPKAVDVRTAEGNMRAGVSYLRYLQDRFHGNETLMIAGYNAGPSRYSLEAKGKVPRITETEEYEAKVDYWMCATYGERVNYGYYMRGDSRRRADAKWDSLARYYGYY